jgi:hypothetical protein
MFSHDAKVKEYGKGKVCLGADFWERMALRALAQFE